MTAQTEAKQGSGSKPLDFWTWQFHIINKWQRPKNVDYKLIGFAIILASNGRDGKHLFAGEALLSKQTGLSARHVRNLKRTAIDVGLFTRVHCGMHGAELMVTIPPDCVTAGQSDDRNHSSSEANSQDQNESEAKAQVSEPIGTTVPLVQNVQVRGSIGTTVPLDRNHSSSNTYTNHVTTPIQDHASQAKAGAPAEAVSLTHKSLAELVSEAPNERALEALWRVHKDRGAWSTELTQLASARKAELASASANDSASAELSASEPAHSNVPLPTESASLPELTSRAYESTCDVDENDETCTVYDDDEANEPEASRFMSRGSLSYRPSFSSY